MPASFRGRSWTLRLKDLLRGGAIKRQGSWRELESAYCAALALDPSLTHIWVQYGHALKEQGHLDAAEQAYRRSLALDATLADTNLQLGHVLKLQGRTADAADAYLTAHRLDPGLSHPIVELRALGFEMPPVPPGSSTFVADPEFIEGAYETSPNPGGGGADGRYVSPEHALSVRGLTPCVLEIFDFRYYFYANPLVRGAVGKLNRHRCLLHFCTHGISNVLQCNPDLSFDAEFYCAEYLPWRLSAGNAYWHWLRIGFDRGWQPSRVDWLRDLLGSDRAACADFDFEPCRTFFYANDASAKWTDLFRRFTNKEVLYAGPQLPVTSETADLFVAIGDRFGLAGGNDDAAVGVYERVLASVPDHRKAQLHYADCLQRKRLFLQAVAAYARIIEGDVPSIWCFLHQATCYEALGDAGKALASLHNGISRFPGEFRLRERFDAVAERFLWHEWLVGFAIGKLGRYDEAQLHLQQACEFVSSQMTVTEGLPHEPIRSVAIVGNLDIAQCYFYRIEQKVEHLGSAGYGVSVYNFHNQVNDFIDEIYKFQAVIFYRVPATAPVTKAIYKSREMGLVIFYEIDDLIFAADDYPGTFESYLGQFTLEEYVGVTLDLPRYRHAMSLCDYGIASTPTLASEMAKYVITGQVFVHRNAFGCKHERQAIQAINPPPVRSGERVTIFYGSGAKSHKEDFRDLVEPALVEIVERYGKFVHIVLAGHVVASEAGRLWYVYPTIPAEALDSIKENITLIDPIWDVDAYWDILRGADINLAVLKKTAMADCKSEIKWMEAAMLGIPSVVSGTAAHEEVIEPGVTGLICHTTQEWIAALDLLVRDGELRRRIGLAARQRVLDAYNMPRMGENLAAIFAKTAPVARTPPKPTIVIVNTFYPPQAVGEATRIVRDNVRYLANAFPDEFALEIFTTGWGRRDYQIVCDVCDGVRVTAVQLPLSPDVARADQNGRIEELFAEYVDRIDPALIHFHGMQRLTASVVSAALVRGTPYLITAHDGWWVSDPGFIANGADEQVLYDYADPPATALRWGAAAHQRLMRLKGLLFGANKILGVNDEIADLYRRCGVPNVVTLANGVPDIQKKARTSPRDGRVRLGFLGPLEQGTGFDLIRYAFSAGKFEHLRLTVVDAGLDGGCSRQEVWGGTPVDFVPEIPGERLAEFYPDIDVLLAPTVWFGSFGVGTRQALDCGCWVVASDRASLGDCLTHGENGFVIDVSDPLALIDVLDQIDGAPQRYLETPPSRPEMRRSSEQGDELAALYKSIISSRSTTTATAPGVNPSMAGTAVLRPVDLGYPGSD